MPLLTAVRLYYNLVKKIHVRAATRVKDVVVVGIDAGELPRIGMCLLAEDVGGALRPAAGRKDM